LNSKTFSWNEDGNITYLTQTEKFSNVSVLLGALIQLKKEFFQLPGNVLFQHAIYNESYSVLNKKIVKFLSAKPKFAKYVWTNKKVT